MRSRQNDRQNADAISKMYFFVWKRLNFDTVSAENSSNGPI